MNVFSGSSFLPDHEEPGLLTKPHQPLTAVMRPSSEAPIIPLSAASAARATRENLVKPVESAAKCGEREAYICLCLNLFCQCNQTHYSKSQLFRFSVFQTLVNPGPISLSLPWQPNPVQKVWSPPNLPSLQHRCLKQPVFLQRRLQQVNIRGQLVAHLHNNTTDYGDAIMGFGFFNYLEHHSNTCGSM